MLFLSVLTTQEAVLVNKKPAIDLAIAGFSKFYVSCLEVPSHDAVMASGAMPHGRLASDSLVANANLNSRDHVLTAIIKPMVQRLSSHGLIDFSQGSALTGRDKTGNT
jgi:hypothetical protein